MKAILVSMLVLFATGCGAPFDAGGSGSGGDNAGGAGSESAQTASKGGHAGVAGAAGDADSGTAGATSSAASAGSAGATTGHENACMKVMFDHPDCMVSARPTYSGLGCTAPCTITSDGGYWCCPR